MLLISHYRFFVFNIVHVILVSDYKKKGEKKESSRNIEI